MRKLFVPAAVLALVFAAPAPAKAGCSDPFSCAMLGFGQELARSMVSQHQRPHQYGQPRYHNPPAYYPPQPYYRPAPRHRAPRYCFVDSFLFHLSISH